MRCIVGIDIGGTNIVVGTVPQDGSEMLGLVSEPTLPEQGADAVLARIVKLARASMADERPLREDEVGGREGVIQRRAVPGHPVEDGEGVRRPGRLPRVGVSVHAREALRSPLGVAAGRPPHEWAAFHLSGRGGRLQNCHES